jgi:hypothetical protein
MYARDGQMVYGACWRGINLLGGVCSSLWIGSLGSCSRLMATGRACPLHFLGIERRETGESWRLLQPATSASAAEPTCGSAVLHRPITCDDFSEADRCNALHLPASLCELIFSAASEACYEAWAWTRLADLQSIRPETM